MRNGQKVLVSDDRVNYVSATYSHDNPNKHAAFPYFARLEDEDTISCYRYCKPDYSKVSTPDILPGKLLPGTKVIVKDLSDIPDNYGPGISEAMYDMAGDILTIQALDPYFNNSEWYTVAENNFTWDISFLIPLGEALPHQ